MAGTCNAAGPPLPLSAMNRTDRLVAMVMFLQGRRLVKAEELADHFEISVRTIYRDISALSESGVPISGEAGVGYTLLKSYHLPPVMLTAEEASALFVGAAFANRFTDASLKAALDSALLKVRAVLPAERQEFVEQMIKKTVVLGRAPRGEQSIVDKEWLLPLQEAAVRRRCVRLRYQTTEETTDREVEPLGMAFYGESWYLVAWCRLRNSLRHFRFDRIQNVTVLSETFASRPEFSLLEHMKDVAVNEGMTTARIRFSHRVIERVRRETYIVITSEDVTNGGVEVSMRTFSIEWMAHWLLSFAGDAEAIEPESLRRRVRDLAELTFQRHAGMPEAQPELA